MTYPSDSPPVSILIEDVPRDSFTGMVLGSEKQVVDDMPLRIAHRNRRGYMCKPGHLTEATSKRLHDTLGRRSPFFRAEEGLFHLVGDVAPRLLTPESVHAGDISCIDSFRSVPENVA